MVFRTALFILSLFTVATLHAAPAAANKVDHIVSIDWDDYDDWDDRDKWDNDDWEDRWDDDDWDDDRADRYDDYDDHVEDRYKWDD